MVKAADKNVLESEDYLSVKTRFNELKAMFKEISSQKIGEEQNEDMKILKPIMSYKSRKQEVSPQDAAKVLKKASNIAIFTGDIIRCTS